MSSYHIEGMKELENTIKTLEKLPQKCVNKAVRKGIMVAKSAAKQAGFVDQTGYLRKGIIPKAEKTKVKGKKVYEVAMDSKMNDVFVKTSKAGKRAYYPASQEYGFRTKSGGYVPGFHYLRKSLVDNSLRIEKTIVDVLSEEIDKLK